MRLPANFSCEGEELGSDQELGSDHGERLTIKDVC